MSVHSRYRHCWVPVSSLHDLKKVIFKVGIERGGETLKLQLALHWVRLVKGPPEVQVPSSWQPKPVGTGEGFASGRGVRVGSEERQHCWLDGQVPPPRILQV